MIKAGIVGGAGYTAGELFRLLVNHPDVDIAFAQSRSQSGKPVTTVHTSLLGEIDLTFEADADYNSVDVLFLCMGHGQSSAFMEKHTIADEVRIVDLSTDFRAESESHPFVYGLPELQRDRIRSAKRIANPGCFATAIQLALLPLAKNGLLDHPVHIHAVTGSTGAGQAPSATTHFSWRNNNLSIYKAFRHQHLKEIGQSVQMLQPGFDQDINFLPMRGNFPRGIYASTYLYTSLSLDDAKSCFDGFYADAPFIFRAPDNPDLKQVVNTNKGIYYLDYHEGKLLIISMIDNLLKGASGQAVQNMNLLFGLDEDTGLRLKPSQF
ncbi:MAG: N-acetyl-gamma-glutamyl-phosphate reductase [Mameliella sp.]|nr:N-acetyl-gamma-glutamyl-phosphate reductase [Phaeodactylibacter sp.]NRA50848.1 N-acetyl-gamma-glutamyl-phosphate reductase [Phaeodactylibacter sp.]